MKYTLLIFTLFLSCAITQKLSMQPCPEDIITKSNKLTYFYEISSNDSLIAYSKLKNESDMSSDLVLFNIHNKKETIIASSPNRIIEFPQFSNSNDTIYYVKFNYYFIHDLKTNNIDSVRCRRQIRDFELSSNGKRIFYISAGNIRSTSSPTAKAPLVPDDLNIFSSNIDGSEKKILSINFKFYLAYSLTNFQNNLYFLGQLFSKNPLALSNIKELKLLKLNLDNNELTETNIEVTREAYFCLDGNEIITSNPLILKKNSALVHQSVRPIINPKYIKRNDKVYFLEDANHPCPNKGYWTIKSYSLKDSLVEYYLPYN